MDENNDLNSRVGFEETDVDVIAVGKFGHRAAATFVLRDWRCWCVSIT